jgi:heterotetrameric sarcosine oxidase delta subunit
MRIRCPYCGLRPSEEYTYLGDAGPERPQTSDPSAMDAWFDYVYLRENPKGRMIEYWHHSGGCRSWLIAERNTETHEILSTVAARDFAKEQRG